MNPELLAKARQMALRMRADGVPDEHIDMYMQDQIGMSLEQVMSANTRDALRAGGMGATFGFLDELAGAGAAIVPGGKGYTEARDEVRQNYDAAKAANPGKMLAAEVGGGIAGSLAGGGLLGAGAKALGIGAKAARASGVASKAARGAVTGAGAGAVAGAGYGDENVGESILGGAGAGLVAGGVLPLAGAAVGGATRAVRDAVNPGRAVAREAATQLPDDAAKLLARQDKLAPGTAVTGDVSEEMIGLMSGVGADPRAAHAAKKLAAERLKAVRDAKQAVGNEYDAFNKLRLPLSPEVRKVLRDNGTIVQGTDIDFRTVQKLRTALRERMTSTNKSGIKQEAREGKKVLDGFLQHHVPDVKDIDSRYSFLLQREDMAKKLEKTVRKSSRNYAKMRAYGTDAGTVGGSLPRVPRGLMDRLMAPLEPNRGDRARAAHQLLMTPGGPTVSPYMPRVPQPGLLSRSKDVGAGWLGGRLSGGLLGQ